MSRKVVERFVEKAGIELPEGEEIEGEGVEEREHADIKAGIDLPDEAREKEKEVVEREEARERPA